MACDWISEATVDSLEFENLVRLTLEEQLRESEITVYQRRRIRGRRSGFEHEIDLSFEVVIAGTTVSVIVECKAYKRPVSVDDILEFCSRIEDIGAHKGILVSASGFTDGAEVLAQSSGVALVHAYGARWDLVQRMGGNGPPKWSKKWFCLMNARIVSGDRAVLLRLAPVDEGRLYTYALDDAASEALKDYRTSSRFHTMSVVLMIVEPGGVTTEPGFIDLAVRTSTQPAT
jgi:Restriction endonuclease